MRTFFVILFLIGFKSFYSQPLDSIKNSFQYHPILLIKLEARNSFISAYPAKLKAIKVGLNFNNTIKTGFGYSWMSSDYQSIYNNDTVAFKMNEFCGFIDYTFYKTDNLYLEIPFQLGVSKLKYLDNERQIIHTHAFIYESAITIEYKFLRFFGIGMGAGYRIVLYNHNQINEKLTSPIYIFKFKVYFGDIYNKHFKNQQ